MTTTSRRTFLKTSAAAAGGVLMARSAGHAAAEDVVVPKLSQFEYSEVQLLDGPALEQYQSHIFSGAR